MLPSRKVRRRGIMLLVFTISGKSRRKMIETIFYYILRLTTCFFSISRSLLAPIHRVTVKKLFPIRPFLSHRHAIQCLSPYERLDAADGRLVLRGVSGFSFKACSWMMFYHLGVARALVGRIGYEALENIGFGGSSSGSLMAAAIACRVDLNSFRNFAYGMVDFASGRLAGPAAAMTHIVRAGLDRHIAPLPPPTDGRLVVNITKVSGLRARPLTVSKFEGTSDLIDALMASCYIPVYYEEPRFFRGGLCVDGGLTMSSPPVGSGTSTVFVSPIHLPSSDQCTAHLPLGSISNTKEPYPVQLAFFPSCRSDYEKIEADGANDTLKWIETRIAAARGR